MISWLIIIVLVAIGILAMKMNHLRHRFFIIMIIVIALFFYASITFVASKNQISLNTYDGFLKAIQIYGGWLVNLLGNFKSLTGNAVKMDWSSTNSSFFDKNDGDANNVSNVVDTPVKTGQASIRLTKR